MGRLLNQFLLLIFILLAKRWFNIIDIERDDTEDENVIVMCFRRE